MWYLIACFLNVQLLVIQSNLYKDRKLPVTIWRDELHGPRWI
jgi:hypothetical protein